MLNLVLTESQFVAVRMLDFYLLRLCPVWRCSEREWQELVDACYCWRDGNIYRAHEVYTTPGFEMSEPDAQGMSSEAAEQDFELRREHMYESGKLQL